ncbi:MAG: hypothetical protein JOZ84_00920 [Methylobacteriaceae bacterium]|nr:hypothetical protein [Methylobacteriaceae bacterium]
MGARRGGPKKRDVNNLWATKLAALAADLAQNQNYKLGDLLAVELLQNDQKERQHWYDEIAKYSAVDRGLIESAVKLALADANNPIPIHFEWKKNAPNGGITIETQGNPTTQINVTINNDKYAAPDD